MLGLRSIAGGIRQGVADYGNNMRRIDEDKRIKDRDEREKTAFETQQQAAGLQIKQSQIALTEAERKAEAQKELEESSAQIRAMRTQGGGAFAQAADPEAIQAQASVQQKVGNESNTESRRLGILTPEQIEQAPSRSITPGKEQNAYMAPGAGLYKNQKAADDIEFDLKASALQKFYEKTGQTEKAMAVPSVMQKLRDDNFSSKLRAASSALAAGVPEALAGFNSVYAYITDGYQIDPKSSKFDPATGGYKGVKIVDTAGKVVATQDWGPERLLQLAGMADPLAAMKYQIESGFKGREVAAKEEDVKTGKRNADSNAIRAGADATDAATRSRRADALTTSEANATQQRAKADAINKIFPAATKEYKIEELLGPDGEKRRQAQAIEIKMRDKTMDLVGLNPKVDVNVIAAIAKNGSTGKIKAEKDEDGRLYTMYGGSKVYLN